MIDRKLEQLAMFIKEIDAQPHIDLIVKAIQTLPSITDENLQDENDVLFKKDLSKVILNAQKNQIDDNILINQLYQHLFILLRTKMIYQYADTLGIEQHLFKDQMNMLFKGKFK
jgi:hypothetical protein